MSQIGDCKKRKRAPDEEKMSPRERRMNQRERKMDALLNATRHWSKEKYLEFVHRVLQDRGMTVWDLLTTEKADHEGATKVLYLPPTQRTPHAQYIVLVNLESIPFEHRTTVLPVILDELQHWPRSGEFDLESKQEQRMFNGMDPEDIPLLKARLVSSLFHRIKTVCTDGFDTRTDFPECFMDMVDRLGRKLIEWDLIGDVTRFLEQSHRDGHCDENGYDECSELVDDYKNPVTNP